MADSSHHIVILGIGNLLWADEGFGVRAVEALHAGWQWPAEVELVDGGTQGLALLPIVQAASHLLILDAIDAGAGAGRAGGVRRWRPAPMSAYLLRRLWQMVPTLAGVVLGVFFLFKGFGGDPAEILAGLNASPEQVEQIRDQLGLNRPVWEQLAIFVGQILQFDWGRSWATNEPVAQLFATRLPATLTVMVPILVLDALLAIPFALAVAAVRGSLTDRAIMVATTVALSVSFLVYVIVGQWLFAFQLGWFPVQGWTDSVWTNLTTYAPLPVLLAVMVGISPQMRLYRSFFLDEIGQDFVRTARAKGLSRRAALWRHVLRNAMIPVVTVMGLQFANLLAGTIVVENVFYLPGLGRLIFQSIANRDLVVVRNCVMLLAAMVVLVNFVVDLLYAAIDPRVKVHGL